MMFIKTLPLGLFLALVLFASAGRLDVPAFWLYAVGLWLLAASIYSLLARRSPELIAERLRPPSDRDRATRRMALPLVLGHLVIAGLDVARFHWSVVPLWVQLLGFTFVLCSMLLVGWVLLSNPYASSAVRIQGERDQHVISTGPYAIVRHPMYLGVVLFTAGSGVALGSFWAGLILLPLVAVFIRRTLIEDKMLHSELGGYADYAAKVRWRVIPGMF